MLIQSNALTLQSCNVAFDIDREFDVNEEPSSIKSGTLKTERSFEEFRNGKEDASITCKWALEETGTGKG